MKCPDCGEKMTYHGPVEGKDDWVYMGYKCGFCGRDALGPCMAKKLTKAPGWYEAGAPRKGKNDEMV